MSIDSPVKSPAWAIEQMLKLNQYRPDLVEAAIERLFSEDEEIRWALVIGAYMDGNINLGKAAELMGMHEPELKERFLELGIPLRVGPSDLSEARAEVEAARNWFGEVGA